MKIYRASSVYCIIFVRFIWSSNKFNKVFTEKQFYNRFIKLFIDYK